LVEAFGHHLDGEFGHAGRVLDVPGGEVAARSLA
jgi:hypothetical protein